MAERKKLRDYIGPWQATLKRATFRRYSYCFIHVLDFVGDRRPEDIFRRDAVTYSELRARQGASANTINTEMSAASSLFSWLADHDIIEDEHNPFRRAKRPQIPPPMRKALSTDALHALCAAADTFENKLMLAIINQTGLRETPVALLKKENFDLERKQCIIRGKGARVQILPVQESLIDVIAVLPNGFIFPTVARSNRPGSVLASRFKRIAKKALGYDPGLHALRHTFCTDLLRYTDIRTAQELMGHASISTTARYLTPADTESVRAFLVNRPSPLIVLGDGSPSESTT